MTEPQQNSESDSAQLKIDSVPRTAEHPVWLAVPHEARETVRQAAGLLENGRSAIAWDKEASLWYARPGCDLSRVSEWLPDPTRRAGGGDAESEFLDALTQAGLVIQGLPVMDGARHRVSTVEDKHGKQSGVYRGFLDRRPGGWFINYHRAETAKDVTNWSATGGESDPVTRLHIRAGAKQAQEDAARERAALYAAQTQAASTLYDRLPPADPAHPYLVRKGITPTPELRETRNGALVVPFFNASGSFKTLQYIPPEGEKFLFKDAPKQGHFLVVGGTLEPGQPVLYAEGYATARSLNLATGHPVVMTIDAGNMVSVAKVLHEQFPQSRHVFLADFDHAKDENKGLLMATAAAEAVGGHVVYPAFNEAEKAQGLTDFNDLHLSRGLEALREQVLPTGTDDLKVTTMPDDPNIKDLNALPSAAVAPAPEDASARAMPDSKEPDSATPASMAVPVIPETAAVSPVNNPSDAQQASLAFDTHTQPAAPSPAPGTVQADPMDVPAVATEQLQSAQPQPAAVQATPLPAAELDAGNTTEPPLPVTTTQPLNVASDKAVEQEAPTLPNQDAPKLRQPAMAGEQPVEAATANAIFVDAPRPRGSEEVPQASNLDKDALLARLSWEKQGDTAVLYKLDGEAAFVDHGNRLEMASGASQSDEKVIAALLTAAQYYRGRIELTGSDEFKAKAIELIAHHKINVEMKNPAQQALLDDSRRALNAPPVVPDAVVGQAPPAYDNRAPSPEGNAPITQQPQRVEPQPGYRPLETADLAQGMPRTAGSALETTALDHRLPAANPLVEPSESTASPKISPAIHQPFQAAKDGIQGKVLASGQAPFRFDENNAESTYIKLRTKTGVQTFWGKELAGLLRETRVQPGKMVTLQWLGNEPVTIKVPNKDKQGVTLGFYDKQVHRNQWALTVSGSPMVRTGQDEGVKLGAYDAARFAVVQQALINQLGVDVPMPAAPRDGLYWLTPNGEGSAKAGDELSAPRPPIDPKNTAGDPVISSWTQDGHLDMYLVRGDGPYLQGIARQGNQFQHVLVSLPGRDDAPPMVFNAITPEGLMPIGTGNGINRSGGEPVARENIAFKLDGDNAVRIGKLDAPADVPPALHARLGFDERWKEDNALPKSGPTAAPSVQPSDPRPA